MGNLGRHSLVYGAGIILTKAVSFVMIPVYTRFLNPSDYGVLQLITMVLEVVSIAAGSRIAFGIFHFYHKAQTDDGRRDVLSTALLLLAVTYGLAAMATIALAPQIATLVFGAGSNHALYVRLAAMSLAFESLLLVPASLFQLRERSKLFVLVSLARLALQVIMNLVLLAWFRMGVTGVLLGNLIANIVVGVVVALFMFGDIGMRFQRSVARDFLRFGLPLVAMQVATFIYTFGDRYFLNRAAGAAAVGLYGLAYQFGFLVAALGYTPFQRVWDPQRFAVAKRADRDVIYARVFVYLSLVLVSGALIVSLFAGDMLRIIAAPAFRPAAVFVPLLAGAYVIHCWGNFLNIGIYITERTEYFTAANWAAAAVAMAGYLLLIPRWEAWGAAWATLASVVVRCWLAYAFSQRLWPVRYAWRPVLTILAWGIATGVAGALMSPTSLPLSVGLHAALFAANLALIWRIVLSDDERLAIRRRLPLFGRLTAG